MARFKYLEPHTLRQAITLLERHGSEARVVAGSTDFLVRWRQGTWRPAYVVNIQHIPGLSRISYGPRNGLRIGALASIQSLEEHPAVRQHYPALASGAASFAGVQVRNLATVGGNICNASPAGDTLPALLVFDAQCRIAGPDGERWVPLDQFFTGPGRTVLQPGEVLTQVNLPPPLPDSGSLYIKHSPRGAMDIAAVGVAAAMSLQDRGRVCRDAKIALAAVAPTPVRAYRAEEVLRGQRLAPELISEAARVAQECAAPIDDVRGTADYRKAVVAPLARRALERALELARGDVVPFEVQRELAVQTAF